MSAVFPFIARPPSTSTELSLARPVVGLFERRRKNADTTRGARENFIISDILLHSAWIYPRSAGRVRA